jgi:hypothetical protein
MKFKIGIDVNGNKVCKVMVPGERGFSIQTNGNLPHTHRDGVGAWTEGEVVAHVLQYGTENQRAGIAIDIRGSNYASTCG